MSVDDDTPDGGACYTPPPPRRTRRAAKDAGRRMETATARYLARILADDRIEVRSRTGAHDRGDITGVRTPHGRRLVIECKDHGGQYHIGAWLREADTERGNDDAIAGVVVAKRRGTADPGDQVVVMTLRDLAAILTGHRENPA